jgi:hypothetical protein
MPHIVHPWSTPLSSFVEVLPVPVTPFAETSAPASGPIASALFAAGFVASAIAIAEASADDDVRALADQWRQTRASDEALAALIERGAGAVVPSVAVRDDGAPRFVLRMADADAAVHLIAREHGDDGVAAELRLFLDEALANGDRYVDAAPGAGFAALTAATAAATVSVVVLCEDGEQCAAIEDSARWSDASEQVTVREASSLDAISFAPAMAGASTILHAGSAAAVAPLLTGARAALERREIGAVAWRCGRADDTGRDAESLQVAAAVLGVFGFQHFALAQGAHGIELVPAEAMASNEMIFSLEPSFLARFAG